MPHSAATRALAYHFDSPELACYIFNFKFGLLLAKPANDFLVSIRLIRNPICQLTVSILARAPCRLGPLIASLFEYLSFFLHTAHILVPFSGSFLKSQLTLFALLIDLA